MDFAFIKDVVTCYDAGRTEWLVAVVEEHSAARSDFLKRIKHDFDDGLFGKKSSKIFLEYFEYANIQNATLKEGVVCERYFKGS